MVQEGQLESTCERHKLMFEEWKVVTQVQIRFKDMIMRVRGTRVSVVLAAFVAAADSLQMQ